MKLNSDLSKKCRSILQELNIDYHDGLDRLSLACPIHRGDNLSGCSIYFNDDHDARFVCFTQNCHESGSTLCDFFKKILSSQAYQKLITNIDDYDDFIPLPINKRFYALTYQRDDWLKKIYQPSDYFCRRGFNRGLLREYDIGIYTDKKSNLYNRHVIPVYDVMGTMIIGATGRSSFEQCGTCKQCHPANSSCNSIFSPKWVHSRGFRKSFNLFNIWKAGKKISKTRTVYLTEGPLDVLKMVEAGYDNVVACFGSFSKSQEIILSNFGVKNIVCLMDNDKAGQKFNFKIMKDHGNKYSIYFPHFVQKDIGEMSVLSIKSLLG